jgi:Bacterial transcriptional regulator
VAGNTSMPGTTVASRVLALLAAFDADHRALPLSRLQEQLRRVHRDGFAQTVEEMSLGACSVAVPVTTSPGTVIAALGLVVARLGRDRPRLVSALQVAARGIGRCVEPQAPLRRSCNPRRSCISRRSRGWPVTHRHDWHDHRQGFATVARRPHLHPLVATLAPTLAGGRGREERVEATAAWTTIP